jgi:hypothetical protein
MKNTLKTFLAGKNGKGFTCLLGAKLLTEAVDRAEQEYLSSNFNSGQEFWCIDVLDDGTAITYCMDNDK